MPVQEGPHPIHHDNPHYCSYSLCNCLPVGWERFWGGWVSCSESNSAVLFLSDYSSSGEEGHMVIQMSHDAPRSACDQSRALTCIVPGWMNCSLPFQSWPGARPTSPVLMGINPNIHPLWPKRTGPSHGEERP